MNADRTFPPYRYVLDGQVAVVIESRIKQMALNLVAVPSNDPEAPTSRSRNDLLVLAVVLKSIANGRSQY